MTKASKILYYRFPIATRLDSSGNLSHYREVILFITLKLRLHSSLNLVSRRPANYYRNIVVDHRNRLMEWHSTLKL